MKFKVGLSESQHRILHDALKQQPGNPTLVMLTVLHQVVAHLRKFLGTVAGNFGCTFFQIK